MSINQLRLIQSAVAQEQSRETFSSHHSSFNPLSESLHLLLVETPISLSIDF